MGKPMGECQSVSTELSERIIQCLCSANIAQGHWWNLLERMSILPPNPFLPLSLARSKFQFVMCIYLNFIVI